MRCGFCCIVILGCGNMPRRDLFITSGCMQLRGFPRGHERLRLVGLVMWGFTKLGQDKKYGAKKITWIRILWYMVSWNIIERHPCFCSTIHLKYFHVITYPHGRWYDTVIKEVTVMNQRSLVCRNWCAYGRHMIAGRNFSSVIILLSSWLLNHKNLAFKVLNTRS